MLIICIEIIENHSNTMKLSILLTLAAFSSCFAQGDRELRSERGRGRGRDRPSGRSGGGMLVSFSLLTVYYQKFRES